MTRINSCITIVVCIYNVLFRLFHLFRQIVRIGKSVEYMETQMNESIQILDQKFMQMEKQKTIQASASRTLDSKDEVSSPSS